MYIRALYVDWRKILERTGLNTNSCGDVNQIRFGIGPVKNVQDSMDVYSDCAAISDAYIGPESYELTFMFNRLLKV